MSHLQQRPLYGGALEITIESRYFDISQVRDVPDNQEIFSDANKDESIVIELLEYVHTEVLEEAANIHWNELVEVTHGAQQEQLLRQSIVLPSLPP